MSVEFLTDARTRPLCVGAKHGQMPRLFLSLIALGLSGTLNAQFQLLENFEGLTGGSELVADSSWSGDNGFMVAEDPDLPTNQVVRFGTGTVGSSQFARYNPTLPGLDNTTVTLFLRFKVESAAFGGTGVDSLQARYGLSPAEFTPDSFAEIRTEVGVDDLDGDNVVDPVLNVYDADTPIELLSETALEEDTWYNSWIIYHRFGNEQDFDVRFSTGLHGADSPAITGLGWTGTAAGNFDDLQLLLGYGATDGYPHTLLIDDIYFDTSGENLTNPIPEPAAVATWTGLLALGFLLIRRARFGQ